VAAQKALLVGIDRYEQPEFFPLKGAVNDAFLVRSLLKRYLGFTNEDIRILVNERATKRAIVERLTSLVRDAEEGDLVVFYFAGHGSQIRDRNGDDLTDHLDEVICPFDMDWDARRFILDDDLDDIFEHIGEGVLLEAVLDTCFWGAMTEEHEALPLTALGAQPDVRFLPPPLDLSARFEGEEYELRRHRIYHCECFSARNVLWAASSEGQISAEDEFDGRSHGVFTYFGCRFIEENYERMRDAEYTRDELLVDVRAFLQSQGYAQVPELSAPRPLRLAPPLRPVDTASAGTALWPREPWTPFGLGFSSRS
jgi:hypothetical protein